MTAILQLLYINLQIMAVICIYKNFDKQIHLYIGGHIGSPQTVMWIDSAAFFCNSFILKFEICTCGIQHLFKLSDFTYTKNCLKF